MLDYAVAFFLQKHHEKVNPLTTRKLTHSYYPEGFGVVRYDTHCMYHTPPSIFQRCTKGGCRGPHFKQFENVRSIHDSRRLTPADAAHPFVNYRRRQYFGWFGLDHSAWVVVVLANGPRTAIK